MIGKPIIVFSYLHTPTLRPHLRLYILHFARQVKKKIMLRPERVNRAVYRSF